MNKNIKVFIGGYFLLIFIFVIYEIKSENAMVDWNIVSIIIFLIFTDSIFIIFRHKKLYKLIAENEYELVLKKVKKIRMINFLDNQVLCINVAVLCLQNEDIYNFYKYINKVKHKKLIAIRYYWETIFFIWKNDLKNAKKRYALFLEAPKALYKRTMSYDSLNTVLSGFLAFYDGDENIAKEKLSSIYDKFTSSITKNLCDKILMKINT